MAATDWHSLDIELRSASSLPQFRRANGAKTNGGNTLEIIFGEGRGWKQVDRGILTGRLRILSKN